MNGMISTWNWFFNFLTEAQLLVREEGEMPYYDDDDDDDEEWDETWLLIQGICC